MGLGDDGDNLVTFAQTRCPGARRQRSHQDFLVLIVPGGAGIAAQFNLVDRGASHRAGPVSAIESVGGSRGKCSLSAKAGCEDAVCLLATMRLIGAEPGQPDGLGLGAQ
jgi:hypothetical protein